MAPSGYPAFHNAFLAFPALANFSKGRSPSGEKVGKRTLLGRPLRNIHIFFNDQGFDLFWIRIRIGHGNSPTKRVCYQHQFRCALFVFVFQTLQSTMNILYQCVLRKIVKQSHLALIGPSQMECHRTQVLLGQAAPRLRGGIQAMYQHYGRGNTDYCYSCSWKRIWNVE